MHRRSGDYRLWPCWHALRLECEWAIIWSLHLEIALGGTTMDRALYLQDDTFLCDQNRFTQSDGAGLLDFLFDDPILDVLADALPCDLSPFRQVVFDIEWWLIDNTPSPEMLQRRVRALRADLDTAWQTPAHLAAALTQLLEASDGP